MRQDREPLEPDPVIEAYKKEIDRTLLRANMKLTPEERLLNLMALQRFADELGEAGRRARQESRNTPPTMPIEVTTHYLEMTAPRDLRPKRLERADLTLARVDPPMPELNRFFYTVIGGDWYWVDRLPWSYEQWLAFLGRPGAETWVLSVAGVPAGYVELDPQSEGDVEIAYFGILPRFAGQGLGGHLLTAAVERAWAMGARRVWVHTCSLDHPAALAHYQARGFRVYHTEVAQQELPGEPPGPWPGARRTP